MRTWILLGIWMTTIACGPGRGVDGTTTDTSTGTGDVATNGTPTTGAGDVATNTTSSSTSTSNGLGTSTSGPDALETTGSTTTAVAETTAGDTTTGHTTTGDTTIGDITGETEVGSSTGVDFMCASGGDEPAPDDPAPCACIVDQESGPVEPMLPTCGEDSCDMALATAYPFELVNPDALLCALASLRDRKTGLLRYDLNEDANYGRYSGYILILDDATAIVRRWGHEDLSYWVEDAVHVVLPDPCAFEMCLAEPEDWKRFDCLRDFPHQQLGLCDEGWGGDF